MKKPENYSTFEPQKIYSSNNNLRKPGDSRSKVNFVKENIKRAGQSKEKFTLKSHRANDSTGMRSSYVLSPKNTKEIPKEMGISSIGSIGSPTSPTSPSNNRYNNIAGRKNLKKLRQKDAYGSTVANFYGQTGTTGGTSTLGGTGTTNGANKGPNKKDTMKVFSAGHQDVRDQRRKQAYISPLPNSQSTS